MDAKQIELEIKQLLQSISPDFIGTINPLPASGSDRKYFLVALQSQQKYIAAYNTNVPENKTFIEFSKQLFNAGLPVPSVIAVNQAATIYLQTFEGEISLLEELLKKGFIQDVYALYEQAVKKLVQFQFIGNQKINYNQAYAGAAFDEAAIRFDLSYFINYFLRQISITYNQATIEKEFENVVAQVLQNPHQYFMYRDFQARNILINNKLSFIDFQGGKKGPLQYDLVSLLWQAKAALPETWKNSLYNLYVQEVEQVMGVELNKSLFREQYEYLIVLRLLQVLGAYGNRGWVQHKVHFLESMPLAIKSLQLFLAQSQIGNSFSYLQQLLQQVAATPVHQLKK